MVYVNEIARQAMMAELKPNFPLGSIIVREKFQTEKSTTPALLSVMIKRAKGFSSGDNDWEFIVADGAEGKLQLREKTINCMSCHSSRIESDYVFRDSLSRDVRLKLH